MAYSPYLARVTHFQFDANEGVSEYPLPSGLDSEIDAIHESLNQQNAIIRRITTADGRLRNVAASVAMSLAGSDDVTATVNGQTDFVTTIDWDAAFSTGSVMVFVGGERVEVSTVQDDGSGFLEVTIAAQDDTTVVSIYAFSGTPIPAAAGDITIADVGAYTAQTNVEDALQELFSHTQGASGKSWLEGVLVMSAYLLKTGGTVTGNIAMSGGATITGLPASASNGHAVRHEQVVALQTSITGITATFMPKSGGTFTGAVDFNGQVVDGIPTPTTSDGAASKGYVDTTLASFGGLPVGTVIDYAAAATPTGWLPCDGAAVSRTTYASLFAVIGVGWGVGDGSTTFNVPDFRGRVSIGTGSGSGLTTRTLADSGGTETHVLDITEIPAHTHELSPVGTDTGGAQNVANDVGTGAGATGSAGGGLAHQNMQPYKAITKIIKY